LPKNSKCHRDRSLDDKNQNQEELLFVDCLVEAIEAVAMALAEREIRLDWAVSLALEE
jgi:hypothetical protein